MGRPEICGNALVVGFIDRFGEQIAKFHFAK